MNRRVFPSLFLLFCFGTIAAQQFGALPPSTSWQQLNSDTLRVIFPKKVSPTAQRVTSIIQQMARQNANSLGSQVRKINILLHPNTTLANGYVALGPFRSEYYLIPGSNIFEFGATPWADELAVHEYRHVQQYSNFNNGLSKAAGFLFGQQGQALFNALAVPDWFFEGDAVHSETVCTTQGRGRLPYFFNGFRALWADGRRYSWMKLRNGSLKDFVPNHYNLGYLLTNYGYQKYGPGFWGAVTNDASRFRSLFFPFQKAVERASGKSFQTFREEALQAYAANVSTNLNPARHETVADYLFPQPIGKDSLLYIKTAYDRIPAFYIRDITGEHRLKQRNITGEDWLAYRNGIIAYTGYEPHSRWGLTDFSNIYLLDIATRQEKKITSKQRYFTPDIRPDGKQVVAVAFTDSVHSELHFLTTDGIRQRRIKPQQEGDLFVHPRYIDNQSVVVAIRHADATMSLERIRWQEQGSDAVETDVLVGRTPALIGYSFVAGDNLYFVSSASGNDEVYSLQLNGKLPAERLVKLTEGVTGSYFPSVSGNKLYRSRFTSNGFRVEETLLSSREEKVIPLVDFARRKLPYAVANDSLAPNLLRIAGSSNLPAQRYKKTTGLLNFHSRQVNYSDPEFTVSVLSDNMLNTFSNELFYRFNQNESSHAAGFTSYYGGFFPVLKAGFTYTANRNLKTTTNVYTLDQKEARFGYYIPLNFSGGKLYKFLNVGTDYVYSETTPTGKSKGQINGRTAGYLSHALTWSEQLPKAVQQIYPKFGYSLGAWHRHLLGQAGFQFLGGAGLILPSVKNHSLVLTANWQETDTSNVIFSNRFSNSRGYNDYFFSRMWRIGGNYHMPLIYPDWGFGNMLYLLRVRSNLFYDYTKVFSKTKLASREQRSIGGEIYFDTRWWNLLPVSLGFRVSHLLDDDFSGQRPKGSNRFELIIPVNIIPR